MRIKKFVEVKCYFCGNKVLKEQKEFKRRLKEGHQDFFCNLSCAAKSNDSLIKNSEFNKKNPTLIQERMRKYRLEHPNSRFSNKDELSPFRYYIRRIDTRKRTKLSKSSLLFSDITAEDLKLKWEEQKGICPYTGHKMQLIPTRGKTLLNQASIDRIDSKFGYLKTNIEFVCLGVNYAKNGFSKQETLDFFRQIPYNKEDKK